MQEAIDWVKRCPNPMLEDSDIEIRSFYEMEDFGEEFTPELREQEANLSAKIAMQNATVQPYLFLGGRCEEALEFYQRALNATIGLVMKFNESPEPCPEDAIPAGFEDKIMHAEFHVGKMTVMVSDGCVDGSTLSGFRLALAVPTEADADRVFNALAEDGTIDMPLGKTFWSPRYGQVTDKFGVGWMVMVPGEQPQE